MTMSHENDKALPVRDRRRSLRAAVLSFGFALCPSLALATGFGNDNQGCAVSEPCFTGAYQAGNRVIFEFNGITGWDFYNVRYPKTGGGEAQVENRSGHFTINNASPNRIYRIKVQGCHSHFLGHSDCSAWVEQSVTTR
jgi:hypothetical protein